jgi:hypothetical protein
MQNLSNMAHFSFSFTDFALLFLPPVVMNTVLAGLVAGKASGEKISAGFIHAFILGIAVVVCLALMPYLTGSLALQSGT